MGIMLPAPGDRQAELTSPGRPPGRICGDHGPRYVCNRPTGHTGRHSFRWYHLGGIIRGVWG